MDSFQWGARKSLGIRCRKEEDTYIHVGSTSGLKAWLGLLDDLGEVLVVENVHMGSEHSLVRKNVMIYEAQCPKTSLEHVPMFIHSETQSITQCHHPLYSRT